MSILADKTSAVDPDAKMPGSHWHVVESKQIRLNQLLEKMKPLIVAYRLYLYVRPIHD